MSDAPLINLDIQKIFNQKNSPNGDGVGAGLGFVGGALCMTALIAGGIIALPAMPAIATGVVIGGAIVGGGAVGALAGAHLKKPIEELSKKPSPAPHNFPGFNRPFGAIDFGPLGSGRAPTVAEIWKDIQNFKGISFSGSWEKWSPSRGR